MLMSNLWECGPPPAPLIDAAINLFHCDPGSWRKALQSAKQSVVLREPQMAAVCLMCPGTGPYPRPVFVGVYQDSSCNENAAQPQGFLSLYVCVCVYRGWFVCAMCVIVIVCGCGFVGEGIWMCECVCGYLWRDV